MAKTFKATITVTIRDERDRSLDENKAGITCYPIDPEADLVVEDIVMYEEG